MSGRLLRSITLVIVAVAFGASPALALNPDPTLGSPFHQNQMLDFRWAAGGTPPSAIRSAIKAAAGDVNASRQSKAPTFAYSTSGGDAIYYGTSVPCGINGLACFSRNPTSSWGIWLRENGHRYDWGVLHWCEASGNPRGCYDAETITLDEMGHVLGLGPPRQPSRRLATTATRWSRPTRGRSRRRATTPTSSRAAMWRPSSRCTTSRTAARRTAPAWTSRAGCR